MKFPMHLPFTDFTLGDEKFTDFMASIGVESGNLTNEFGDLRLNLYGNGVQAVYRRQMEVKSPGIVIHWSQEQQKPASAEPEIEYVWVLQGVVGQVAPQSDLAKIEENVTTKTTLGDLMRKGCESTRQKIGGWGQGENACALPTAAIAAQELGIIE